MLEIRKKVTNISVFSGLELPEIHIRASNALVAQLDRASVYGADEHATQPFVNNQLIGSEKADSPDNSLMRFECPPELQKIIAQWHNLPQHVKDTIKMLVESAGKNAGSLNDLGEM
jgi:hypothetical protein